MTYSTVWKTEDGLTHRATVTGNETDAFEIRSFCGLLGQACWEKQLDEDAEITCHRCRVTCKANQGDSHNKPELKKKDINAHTDNATNHMTKRTMFAEADVIHWYSRKQAIEDGVLVDVSSTAKEAGIRYKTALTRSVWDRFVRVPEGLLGQDEAGRLWDVLWLLRHAARSSESETVFFYLHVRNDDNSAKRYLLKAVCGPDDDGEPCITVMLPEED